MKMVLIITNFVKETFLLGNPINLYNFKKNNQILSLANNDEGFITSKEIIKSTSSNKYI
jgi:hypothetical protein